MYPQFQYVDISECPVNVTGPTYSLVSLQCKGMIHIIGMQIWSEIAPQLYYVSAIKHKWHHDDSRLVPSPHNRKSMWSYDEFVS